jgi:hypothetical protein
MAAEKTQRDTVVMYRVQIEALLDCSSLKDVKSILAMILEYGMNGEDVECPEHLRMIWRVFKSMIDGNNAKWDAAREKYINAGKASAEKRKQSNDVQRCSTMFNDVERCSTNNVNVNVCNTPINGSVLHKRASRVNTAEFLGETVGKRFDAWLETWQDIHGDGKKMPRHTQESQIQALLHLPEEIRLEAVEAAIKGCWKNIRDIRHDLNNSTISEREQKRNATAGSFGRYVPKN